MVARIVRDDEAAGSNPVTPTMLMISPFMGEALAMNDRHGCLKLPADKTHITSLFPHLLKPVRSTLQILSLRPVGWAL